MTRRTLAVWLLVLLPGLAAAASPPAAPPSAASPPAAPPPAGLPNPQPLAWEQYRVLSERNIFLRNRTRPRSGSPAPPVVLAPPANAGDDRIVLTGIIQQGGDGVAFFEDTRTGKTTTAQVGDPVGKGHLTTITLDDIEYTCAGKATRIVVGSNLTGAVASLPKPATTVSAAAPAPLAAPPTPAAPTAVPATQAAGTAPAGTPAAPAAPAPATASATQPPTAPPQAGASPSGGPTDSSAASILERMRQRREQELNR